MEATREVKPQHTDWSSVPVEELEPGIERQMIVGQNMMMIRFRFEPFLVTAEHSHQHEQMTLVMQGRAKFILG